MKDFKQFNEEYQPMKYRDPDTDFMSEEEKKYMIMSEEEEKVFDTISQDITTALDNIYQTYHKYFTRKNFTRKDFNDLVNDIL